MKMKMMLTINSTMCKTTKIAPDVGHSPTYASLLRLNMLSYVLLILVFTASSGFTSDPPARSPIRFAFSLSASSSDSDSDPVIQLPLWQAQLTQNSSNKEQLQSQIDQAKMSGEFGVRKAQLRFYEAFSNQDLDLMTQVWSSEQHPKCCHPGMSSISGKEDILKSWQELFTGEAFAIEPSDASIDICGSTAFCHCVEKIGISSGLEALNIYKREDGEWKMTFHMASPVML
jgi:hypothetical protein